MSVARPSKLFSFNRGVWPGEEASTDHADGVESTSRWSWRVLHQWNYDRDRVSERGVPVAAYGVLYRVSVFAGLDHWTGLLDWSHWTTGLMNNVILM